MTSLVSKKLGFETIFMEALHTIDDMKMYDEFGKFGWTNSLATTTKTILVPEMIKVVCLAWCVAISESKEHA